MMGQITNTLLAVFLTLIIAEAQAADGNDGTSITSDQALGPEFRADLSRLQSVQTGAVRGANDCRQTPAPDNLEVSIAHPPTKSFEYEQCPDRTLGTTDFYHRKVVASKNPLVQQYMEDEVTGPLAQCILLGMKYPKSNLQASCTTRLPTRNLPRNCASAEMHRFVTHAVNDVTDCFNLNKKEVFAKLLLESSFQPAALGAGVDGGISQLTCDALEDFFPPRQQRCGNAGNGRDYFSVMLERLQSSNNGSCRRLLGIAQTGRFPSDARSRCETMYPPENAIKNVLYAGFTMARVTDKFLPILSRVKDPDVRNMLAQRVALMNHNSPAGADALIKVFRSAPANLNAQDAVKYMDRVIRGSSMNRYYSSLVGSSKNFEKLMGGAGCTNF